MAFLAAIFVVACAILGCLYFVCRHSQQQSSGTELQSSNDMIFPMLTWPSAQARRPKLRGIGYSVRSDFELNFGRYLPEFGSAGDGTDTQPD